MTESFSSPARRPLARSSTDRYLGGVCGGLAAHLTIDPVVLRVLLAVGAVFAPWPVFAGYLVLWLGLPTDEGRPRRQGGLLVAAAAALAFSLGMTVAPAGGVELVLLAAAVGVVAAVTTSRRVTQPAVAPVSPEGGQPAEPQVPHWWQEPPPTPRRPYSPLARITVSAALLVAGVALLAGLPLRSAVAASLGTVGAGMLVGTVRGRGRPLLPVATLLAAVLAVVHHATLPEATRLRGVYLQPVALFDVQSWSAATGTVTLDLTQARPVPGFREVTLDVAAGRIVVIVPARLDVAIDATVGVGRLVTYGSVRRGVARTWRDGSGPWDLSLVIHVGVGQVEVRRAQA
jgi:phage shock protein PspC (stress-responsive transcriptional regulator)